MISIIGMKTLHTDHAPVKLLDALIVIMDEKRWTPEQQLWIAGEGEIWKAKMLVVSDTRQRLRITRQFVKAFFDRFSDARKNIEPP